MLSRIGRILLSFALGLPAQGLAGDVPVDQIALELSNPVSALRSVVVSAEYTVYQGDLPDAPDQTAYRTVGTLSWPIRLDSGRHFLLRATIPANGDLPYWKPSSDIEWPEYHIRQRSDLDPAVGRFRSGHGHLGDIGIDIGYGDVSANGLISMIGVANMAPTNDDRSAARGQWLIGPDFTLGQVTDWGIFGARVTHLVNIAGEGKQTVDFDTSETTIRVFFSYALGNGWLIESNPVIFYDWKAVSGNHGHVPLALAASKTIAFGRQPVKLAVEIQKSLVSPDRFGPEWLFSVRIASANL